MKQSILNLLIELNKEYWYPLDYCFKSMQEMQRLLDRDASDNAIIYELEVLLESIPSETEDHDWQKDKLKDAIAECDLLLEQHNELLKAEQ